MKKSGYSDNQILTLCACRAVKGNAGLLYQFFANCTLFLIV